MGQCGSTVSPAGEPLHPQAVAMAAVEAPGEAPRQSVRLAGVGEEVRIAIIGAGVGGAALANLLYRHRNGGGPRLHIVLFERRPAPDGPDGGALTVQGEGLEVLRELGLAAELTAVGAADPDDKLLVVRDVLVNLLLDETRGQVEFRFNTEVAALRETPDGVELDLRPLLVVQDGQWVRNRDTAVTTEAYHLAVGGDGNSPNSRMPRALMGEEAQAEPVQLLVLQALAPRSVQTDALPTREVYLEEGLKGVVGKLSLGVAVGRVGVAQGPVESRVQLRQWDVCTVATAIRDPMRNFPPVEEWGERMRRALQQFRDAELKAEAAEVIDRAVAARATGELGDARLHAWVPFHKAPLKRWRSPSCRLVALGDTAHLMPPTLGWGTSLALGDARSLASALVSSLGPGGAGLEASLAEYEERRRAAAAAPAAASLAEAERLAGGRSRPSAR